MPKKFSENCLLAAKEIITILSSVIEPSKFLEATKNFILSPSNAIKSLKHETGDSKDLFEFYISIFNLHKMKMEIADHNMKQNATSPVYFNEEVAQRNPKFNELLEKSLILFEKIKKIKGIKEEDAVLTCIKSLIKMDYYHDGQWKIAEDLRAWLPKETSTTHTITFDKALSYLYGGDALSKASEEKKLPSENKENILLHFREVLIQVESASRETIDQLLTPFITSIALFYQGIPPDMRAFISVDLMFALLKAFAPSDKRDSFPVCLKQLVLNQYFSHIKDLESDFTYFSAFMGGELALRQLGEQELLFDSTLFKNKFQAVYRLMETNISPDEPVQKTKKTETNTDLYYTITNYVQVITNQPFEGQKASFYWPLAVLLKLEQERKSVGILISGVIISYFAKQLAIYFNSRVWLDLEMDQQVLFLKQALQFLHTRFKTNEYKQLTFGLIIELNCRTGKHEIREFLSALVPVKKKKNSDFNNLMHALLDFLNALPLKDIELPSQAPKLEKTHKDFINKFSKENDNPLVLLASLFNTLESKVFQYLPDLKPAVMSVLQSKSNFLKFESEYYNTEFSPPHELASRKELSDSFKKILLHLGMKPKHIKAFLTPQNKVVTEGAEFQKVMTMLIAVEVALTKLFKGTQPQANAIDPWLIIASHRSSLGSSNKSILANLYLNELLFLFYFHSLNLLWLGTDSESKVSPQASDSSKSHLDLVMTKIAQYQSLSTFLLKDTFALQVIERLSTKFPDIKVRLANEEPVTQSTEIETSVKKDILPLTSLKPATTPPSSPTSAQTFFKPEENHLERVTNVPQERLPPCVHPLIKKIKKFNSDFDLYLCGEANINLLNNSDQDSYFLLKFQIIAPTIDISVFQNYLQRLWAVNDCILVENNEIRLTLTDQKLNFIRFSIKFLSPVQGKNNKELMTEVISQTQFSPECFFTRLSANKDETLEVNFLLNSMNSLKNKKVIPVKKGNIGFIALVHLKDHQRRYTEGRTDWIDMVTDEQNFKTQFPKVLEDGTTRAEFIDAFPAFFHLADIPIALAELSGIFSAMTGIEKGVIQGTVPFLMPYMNSSDSYTKASYIYPFLMAQLYLKEYVLKENPVESSVLFHVVEKFNLVRPEILAYLKAWARDKELPEHREHNFDSLLNDLKAYYQTHLVEAEEVQMNPW